MCLIFLTERGFISANAISRNAKYTDFCQYFLIVFEGMLLKLICCPHDSDHFFSIPELMIWPKFWLNDVYLKDRIWWINSFFPYAPFLYPLKTSENLMVFWCFQGIEKWCIEYEWVKRKTLVEGIIRNRKTN